MVSLNYEKNLEDLCLTKPPDLCLLESECIFNGIVDMFGANSLETERVVLSLALHRDAQAFCKNHFFEQRDSQKSFGLYI